MSDWKEKYLEEKSCKESAQEYIKDQKRELSALCGSLDLAITMIKKQDTELTSLKSEKAHLIEQRAGDIMYQDSLLQTNRELGELIAEYRKAHELDKIEK